jgi:ubiquitin-activating enzyme E1
VIFKKFSDSVIVPEFSPRSGVNIQINENDPVNQNATGKISEYM